MATGLLLLITYIQLLADELFFIEVFIAFRFLGKFAGSVARGKRQWAGTHSPIQLVRPLVRDSQAKWFGRRLLQQLRTGGPLQEIPPNRWKNIGCSFGSSSLTPIKRFYDKMDRPRILAFTIAIILHMPLSSFAQAAQWNALWLFERAQVVRLLAAKEKEERVGENEVLMKVQLKRRNWENHGTDTLIGFDGDYQVTSISLGKTKMVRGGTVAPEELRQLLHEIIQGDTLDLNQTFNAPAETRASWWGYELTITTNLRSKTMRFHSEDETVPTHLKRIIERIMSLTK